MIFKTLMTALNGTSTLLRNDLRTDGIGVRLLEPGVLEKEFALQNEESNDYPFQNFSDYYVGKALRHGIDWRKLGRVTPAKDQGEHGYCGTFGRVAAAEGQYARHFFQLRNFSEEELIDCIGWDQDQFAYFRSHGFMDSRVYPYNTTGPDMDPPIPNNPCRFNATEVIVGTDDGFFTNQTGAAPSEEQLAAFVYHNGPVQTGVNANVFGLREKGCEEKGDCWITAEMCNDPSIKGKPIDHSVTLVGFGTHEEKGEFWIIKNSWSTKFGNEGFIYMQRGISCGNIDCCGNTYTVGDPAMYYENPVVIPSSAKKQ